MRVIYLSQGNIPSRWAHTVQTCKMADALTYHARSVTLVTQRSSFGNCASVGDIRGFYSISPRLRIKQLPTRLFQEEAIFKQVFCRRFDRTAAFYARLLSPDLVYTRSPYTAYLCARLSMKTVFETHVDDSSLPGSVLSSIPQLATLTNIVTVVTLGEANKQALMNFGFPESKIITWPDAVDMAPYVSVPSKSKLRGELGLPADKTIVTYSGHLYDSKGVPSIIECARRSPQVLFLMVGGWPEDIQRVRALASDLANVHMAGFVPQAMVPKYLRASDVLLLPNSLQAKDAASTSPLKMFEYMAAQRPIVASRIPAFAGTLIDKTNAVLVAPDSSDSLQEGIELILRDKQLAESVAQRARKDVERFTWRERAGDILTFTRSRSLQRR